MANKITSIPREELLFALSSVQSGLAQREIIEQSSHFVFTGGFVKTYNDEISCSAALSKNLEDLHGAVKAKPVLDLLGKMSETDIQVSQTKSSLRIGGTNKRTEFKLNSNIMLPVDSVEQPGEWIPLEEKFVDAVNIVQACASKESSQFALTCIHLCPDYMESCDRYQIAKFEISTGVKEPILVRAESLNNIVKAGVSEMSETKAWIHYRNDKGLTISIRRYLDDYLELEQHLNEDDTFKILLPGSMEEVVEKAEIFSSENSAGNNLIVELDPEGRDGSPEIRIKAEGASGRHLEWRNLSYSGPKMKFLIAPQLLAETAKQATECRVSSEKFFVKRDTLRYACRTSTQTKEEE